MGNTETPARSSATRSNPATGHPFPIREIAGLPAAVVERETAIAHLSDCVAASRKTLVVFANANLAITLRRRASKPLSFGRQWLVLNDGIGMDLASRILHGHRFPDNLNGTDFTPALLTALPSNTRVFCFGSRLDVVDSAARRLAENCSVTACGWSSGYNYNAQVLINDINASNPDVLLVALGNPQQEQWISEHAGSVSAPLILGVGALFDFVSGRVSRAPKWVRRIRCEWLFRLMLEPRRLGRRYTLDVATFLILVIRQRFSSK